jgi:hypothetical protein
MTKGRFWLGPAYLAQADSEAKHQKPLDHRHSERVLDPERFAQAPHVSD